jgi:superoxide reductase
MNRRDMIKATGLALVATAIGAEAKEQEAFYNREEMSPKDPKKMTKGEQKHTPLITLGDKDAKAYTLVEVSVGLNGIIHPSTKDHWIDTIELYADDTLVGRTTLVGEISRGAADFRVKLDGVKVLKAKSACNLHGVWTNTYTL